MPATSPGVLPVFPGYISGNWYAPYLAFSGAIGSAGNNTTMTLLLAYFPADVTLSALGTRIATASAGSAMLGIYAHNSATGVPTGPALASVTGLSTASLAHVNAALGANVTLQRGFYWTASQMDNATAAFTVSASAMIMRPALVGSVNQNEVNDGGIRGLQVTNTYGTFPDLTSGSFSASANDRGALFDYKVA